MEIINVEIIDEFNKNIDIKIYTLDKEYKNFSEQSYIECDNCDIIRIVCKTGLFYLDDNLITPSKEDLFKINNFDSKNNNELNEYHTRKLRLNTMFKLNAPHIILRNERRMLREQLVNLLGEKDIKMSETIEQYNYIIKSKSFFDEKYIDSLIDIFVENNDFEKCKKLKKKK